MHFEKYLSRSIEKETEEPTNINEKVGNKTMKNKIIVLDGSVFIEITGYLLF